MSRSKTRGGDGYFSDGNYSEVVFMTCPCGWCMTNMHDSCKSELIWNSKLYLCGCKTCDVHSQYKNSLDKEQEDTTDEEHDEG